jgi:acetyl-CoA carboxylase biotin carboxyl carrier protein
MDIDHIKEILNLVREHDLSELEIEHDGMRLRVRKSSVGVLAPAPAVHPSAQMAVTGVAPPAPQPAHVAGGPVAADLAPEDGEIELAVVKSPIVGTFFRSSEPGAPSFVEVGDTVKKGQVLCIIEAMKLMNEIDSEYDGEIVKVYVESGQPVQYGERLFAIKTF